MRIDNGKLGHFTGDITLPVGAYVITKANAVIKYPYLHVKGVICIILIGKFNHQLVVVIANNTLFSPGLLPGVIFAGAAYFTDLKMTINRFSLSKSKTQPRRAHDLLTVVVNAILGIIVFIGEGKSNIAVW